MRWMWTTFLLLLLLLYIHWNQYNPVGAETMKFYVYRNDEAQLKFQRLCIFDKRIKLIRIFWYFIDWINSSVSDSGSNNKRETFSSSQHIIPMYTVYMNIYKSVFDLWNYYYIQTNYYHRFAIHCKLCFKILICELEMNYYVYFVAR